MCVCVCVSMCVYVCVFLHDRQTINGVPVCGTVVGLGVQEVSFNPLNWKQICVVTREAITLWMLEQCGPNSLLTPTYACDCSTAS